MTHSLEASSFGGDPTPHTQWHWRMEDSSGAEVAGAEGADQQFPSQSDAESWIGEVWQDLLEGGVDAVTLFEGDREVYGPMSLHAST
jgi:hypothetical protein